MRRGHYRVLCDSPVSKSDIYMSMGTENNKQDLMSLASVYPNVPVVDLCILPRGEYVPRSPRLPTRFVYPIRVIGNQVIQN